jgi:ACS family tartrate transporter-like MFS transporter
VNDQNVEFHTMRQVSLRLLPFLLLLYIFCWLDRSNVSIAALQMNQELKFSSAAFGFGAGIYFLSYALFEVPSNLILARVGARLWFARIAVTWGIIACAMMWVQTPIQFYALRFLLGVAEAGFFPGVIYYLGLWFPAAYRARASSCFMIGIPMSQALGASIGGALLGLDGVGHLSGWQWLFLIEGPHRRGRARMHQRSSRTGSMAVCAAARMDLIPPRAGATAEPFGTHFTAARNR